MQKILQFDDDPFIVDIFADAFKKSGFDYKSYPEPPEKGEDLIKLVLHEKPDIIISDITHPKMDGFEMLRILKTNKETIHFPFVFLTNHNDGEEIKKAQAMGALAYFITLEYTPEKLVSAIRDLVEKRKKSNPVMGYKRGVFVLGAKLPSGEDEYFTFILPDPLKDIMRKSDKFKVSYDLAIFNELLFANWFLVELQNSKVLPHNGNTFILQILDQVKWNFVRNKLIADGINGAFLNPCIAKDHRCPTYLFFLDEEKDFNKLQDWFSKAPNKHYTLKGYEKTGLSLLGKPSFDENGEFKFLEE